MMARLLVGILTPAIRATAMTPVAGNEKSVRPIRFRLLHPGAQTITRHPPRPPGPGIVSNFPLDTRVIKGFRSLSSTSAGGALCTGTPARGRPGGACLARRFGGFFGSFFGGCLGFFGPLVLAGRGSLSRGRGLGGGGLVRLPGGLFPRFSGGTWAQHSINRLRDLWNRGHSVDRLQSPLQAVVIDQRRGLIVI